ncbi:MAG: hypothetical protein IGS48_01395 [Oscillatoriales cyanobacterium C42_A2020_001]|nr:hypothetical protein [Leptolyngbyaceae cyanobacterium C42_A2020_001]
MTPDEIEAALQAAFNQCDQADATLSSQQKEILLKAFGLSKEPQPNPLNALTLDERRSLLEFIRNQEQQKLSWKMTLLNDWLQGQSSGPVQFIRDRLGIQWLEQVRLSHLAEYDYLSEGEMLLLKVGDRIEVTNGLWEWVQESGPCSREWFPCTVIALHEASNDEADGLRCHASCIVRFDSGVEYEIQGIYEWNRPNWRWLES